MRRLLLLGFGALVVGLLNFGVVQKERVIANGIPVFLELRPVDPRSLMQGDFMRLGFDVEAQLRTALAQKRIRSGNAIIEVDSNDAARFVRLDDGTALAANQFAVHFANAAGGLNLVPNSFLFQEGEGDDFANAEYAMFVFGADRRDYVLRGLANADRELINPRGALGIDLPAFLQ